MNTFFGLFHALTGHPPMRWQMRLFEEHFLTGKELPSAVSVPTGLGKTAVMAVWLITLAQQMKRDSKPGLPRRLAYVVDRRAVVDQATQFAEMLRKNLSKPEAKEFARALGLADAPLPTLRGQFVDNREWLEDPAKPAIIIGTVDMIGSRLLFEGYGVSHKMRPYHAGLLGADALVLLDEAHLVPPFEALLAEIAGNAGRYGAKQKDLNALVPRFQLLPLSATGRRQTNTPFVLQERDFRDGETIVDAEANKRLHAVKHLTLQKLGDTELEDTLAEQAWALVQDGENALKPVRVIVYCNERKIAEATKAALDTKAKKTSAQDRIELFVGARRVRERFEAEKQLHALGFLANETAERTQPSFLVATSAGEVGVDLDADRMVCDLVAWERMVQRLGRVNRRGKGNAKIVAIDAGEPVPTKAGKPTSEETKRIKIYRAVKQVLDRLVSNAEGKDVSPNALRMLAMNAELRDALVDACTPAPLRPALNRALVDAWAMTSLPEHTGRPEVARWLRGWVDEDPQTAVAWRKHLPVRKEAAVSKKDIEDFFEAAPLHVSETLDTESWRVFEWLKKRAAKLDKIADDEKVLKPDDVVAMLLKSGGDWLRSIKLRELIGDGDGKKKRLEGIERDIAGKTLVIDARFGGLKDGLLKDDAADAPDTADGDEAWMTTGDKAWIKTNDGKPVLRFRVLPRDKEDEFEGGWRESLRFGVERSADGETTLWLSVQKWRDTSNTENDRAEGRPQALAEHQSWTAERATDIGKRLGLPDDYVCALAIAARLHDEGKRAKRWQRAFRAERDKKKFGISDDLAKTRGPINQAVLGGYRHEFGSLPYAKDDAEFKKLSPDMQDLVLHVIVAHHGFARPLIATESCEDAPPSVLEERAREVALRFARLQKRWGPWGLAWWESLLRAADAQASRANDEGSD
jgi:CRISPR-associated endonuclease/helicase Cas3